MKFWWYSLCMVATSQSKCTLRSFGHVQLTATPWTEAHQAPLSMGFPSQEYWSGLPCPPPRDLPDLGIELASLSSPTLAGRFFTSSNTWDNLLSGLKIYSVLSENNLIQLSSTNIYQQLRCSSLSQVAVCLLNTRTLLRCDEVQGMNTDFK